MLPPDPALAKPPLSSSQSEGGNSRQDTLSVLREMLSEAQSAEETAALTAEMEAVQKGAERHRRK